MSCSCGKKQNVFRCSNGSLFRCVLAVFWFVTFRLLLCTFWIVIEIIESYQSKPPIQSNAFQLNLSVSVLLDNQLFSPSLPCGGSPLPVELPTELLASTSTSSSRMALPSALPLLCADCGVCYSCVLGKKIEKIRKSWF